VRVSGDSDQVTAAAEALARAALAVAATADQLRSAQLPSTWVGTAQERWAALALQLAVAGDDVVQRLGHAAGALAQHAQALRELQARAGRLVAEAAEAGLHLDEDGWIRPVSLVTGPVTTSEQLLAQQALLRQQESRAELLARVEALRVDEAATHERLRRFLRGMTEAPELPPALLPAGPPNLWAPTWWDAPAVALGVASGSAGAVPASSPTSRALSGARGPMLVLRNIPFVSVVGTGYGIYVDTKVNGMSAQEAVAKNLTVTAIGTGAAAGVAAGGAAVGGAPAIGIAVAVVGTGVVVSYGVGRIWDVLSNRQPSEPYLVPRPSPGPPPQPPSSVHSRHEAPSPAAPPAAPSS
jgi:hypothetical protein